MKSLSPVRLFVTPWTVAYQAPCPWDFPGKNTGVGLPFPSCSLAYEITQPIKTNHATFLGRTRPLRWPTHCGVCSSLNLNKSTSYLSLCLSLNSFCDETSRASLIPETRYRGFWLGLSPSTWVQVPIWDKLFQNLPGSGKPTTVGNNSSCFQKSWLSVPQCQTEIQSYGGEKKMKE